MNYFVSTRRVWQGLFILTCLTTLSGCRLFKKENRSNTNSATINLLISTARQYTGVPYKSGGTDKRGMDCSGLIFTTFKQVGVDLPRISYQQANIGTNVTLAQVRPGDLVFFATNKSNKSINHSGMITEVKSDNEVFFIHASTSKGIREDNLFTDYWRKCFVKAKRPI